MAAPKKSDPTIIVVLLICVLMGMWQGARGMVEKASVGFGSRGQVSVEGTDVERGTIRVASRTCTDTPDALDTVRWKVTNSAGKVVDQATNSLVADRSAQTATLGLNLPEDRYTVTVSCYADQDQVGESRSTTVVLGSPANGWGGEAADGAQGDQSGRQQGTRPGLPRTGR